MKHAFAVSLLVIMLVLVCGARQTFAQSEWTILKGEHFVVHYGESGSRFASEVLQRAENYYDDILRELGFPRRDNFWLWDNRCRIYLFRTKSGFHKATAQPAWSAGFAVPSQRALVSYDGAGDFLNSTLRHEMAHLIFYDFISLNNKKIPLWLDEGIAVAMEEGRRLEFDLVVEKMIREKSWIPVQTLARIESVKEISVQEAAIFYGESQSLVRFIIGARDSSTFLQFCRDLRDGKPLQDALRKNYPHEFPTLKRLEEKWVASHVS